MIETAAHQISADNTELACAFIQKTAIEKVVPEVEKRLNEVRKHTFTMLAYAPNVACMFICIVSVWPH